MLVVYFLFHCRNRIRRRRQVAIPISDAMRRRDLINDCDVQLQCCLSPFAPCIGRHKAYPRNPKFLRRPAALLRQRRARRPFASLIIAIPFARAIGPISVSCALFCCHMILAEPTPHAENTHGNCSPVVLCPIKRSLIDLVLPGTVSSQLAVQCSPLLRPCSRSR